MNRLVIVDPNAYGGHNDFCHSLATLLSGKDLEIVYVNRENKPKKSVNYKHIATGYSDQSFKNKIKSYINIYRELKKLTKKNYAIHFQDITPYMIPIVSLLLIQRHNKNIFYYTLHNIKPHGNGIKDRIEYIIVYILLQANEFKKVFYHFEFIKTEDKIAVDNIPLRVRRRMVFVPHHMFRKAARDTKNILSINCKNKDINILFFGDIRRNKGVLEFFSLVYNKDIDTKGIKFIVAGAFSEYNKNELEKIINQFNYKINVQIESGFIENERKAELFTEAHYILLPYLNDFLAQSGVVLDAYQYQKPLLVSSNPSLKYLVTHESTGYAYSKESLKSFLEQQICNQEQYDFYIHNINEVLHRKYDNNSIKKIYMNAYLPENV